MRLFLVSDDFEWDEEQAFCSDDDAMYVDGGLHVIHENDMCHAIYIGGTTYENRNKPSLKESIYSTSQSKG